MALESLRAFIRSHGISKEQWMDADGLEALQRERLSSLLSLAKRTLHYGSIFEKASITSEDVLEDITALPLTSKQEVISEPASFIPRGVDRRSLTSIKTSGSTGRPIEVFSDAEDQTWKTAIAYMVGMSYGRGPLDIVADVHDQCFSPSRLAHLGFFRRKHLSVFDSEEVNLARLRGSGANILTGYTSPIAVMADLNRKDPIRLKHVSTSGEILSPETRQLISDSFSCPVYDRYGSNEFGLIACECPEEGRLHVFSSLFIVEVIDSAGRPSKSGQMAITSLKNTGMPLLRYCLGDQATVGGACPCGRGFPTIERLEGRTDDYLILPSGKRRSPFSLFCLYDIPGIRCYQIVQERQDLILFNYAENSEGFDERSKQQVLDRIDRACLGEKVSVEFQQVDDIPKGRTGKRRSVVSRL